MCFLLERPGNPLVLPSQRGGTSVPEWGGVSPEGGGPGWRPIKTHGYRGKPQLYKLCYLQAQPCSEPHSTTQHTLVWSSHPVTSLVSANITLACVPDVWLPDGCLFVFMVRHILRLGKVRAVVCGKTAAQRSRMCLFSCNRLKVHLLDVVSVCLFYPHD